MKEKPKPKPTQTISERLKEQALRKRQIQRIVTNKHEKSPIMKAIKDEAENLNLFKSRYHSVVLVVLAIMFVGIVVAILTQTREGFSRAPVTDDNEDALNDHGYDSGY